MKGCYRVESVEDTWRLACSFASEVKPGDVICLEGELGAGKTTFTQALAEKLGVSGLVSSPTFCIVREHPGGPGAAVPMLVHVDLYRYGDEAGVAELGLEDYTAAGAVLVVEWPDRAGSLIPPDARRIAFRYLDDGDGSDAREIEFL